MRQPSFQTWQCLWQDFSLDSAYISSYLRCVPLSLEWGKETSWESVFKYNLACQATVLLGGGCLNRNQGACHEAARSKTHHHCPSPASSSRLWGDKRGASKRRRQHLGGLRKPCCRGRSRQMPAPGACISRGKHPFLFFLCCYPPPASQSARACI